MRERTQYTPLTVEEQRFAEENHQIVFLYLRSRKLDPEEWYDVVIFRYLLSMKKWFQRPELHSWNKERISNSMGRKKIMKEDKPLTEDCFIPEKDNPYPLCIGQGFPKCKDCQVRADWEPDDPYGVE